MTEIDGWAAFYGILGLMYIVVFPIMLCFYNIGRKRLESDEDEVWLILNGISDSWTYSKRHTKLYRLYLLYILLSPVKTLIFCMLTLSALIELTTNDNGVTVPALYWFGVAVCYFISLIAILLRSYKMYNYYPYNIDHSILNYEKALLPYLVFNEESGFCISVTADYANSLVSIYMNDTDPSISITWKIAVVMIGTVGFLLLQTTNTYLFCKQSKQIDQIKANSTIQQLHVEFINAKYVSDHHEQSDDNNSTSKNICYTISFIITFAFLLMWFISLCGCYVTYYGSPDHSFTDCGIEGDDDIIGSFIFVSVMIPLCLFCACLRCHCYRLNGYLVLLCALTMTTFGGFCISQDDDKYNIYCGPAGYIGGIVLIVGGLCVAFCCRIFNELQRREYVQQMNFEELQSHLQPDDNEINP